MNPLTSVLNLETYLEYPVSDIEVTRGEAYRGQRPKAPNSAQRISPKTERRVRYRPFRAVTYFSVRIALR